MKKILHVVSCLETGGTEAYIMNNYRHIDRQKFSFDFLSFTNRIGAYKDEIQARGGKIFVCGVPAVKDLFGFVFRVVRCIKENGPYDAVHAHINIANAWVMVAAAIAGVPIRISHSHDTIGKEAKHIFRAIYVSLEASLIKMCATKFLACSFDAGAYLYGERHFKAQGLTMCNGIDIEPYLTRDGKAIERLKKEFGLQDEVVFGNISRFEPKKNPLYTVEVFKKILKIKPNSVLLLGGVDDGQLAEVQKAVLDSGIEKNVRFIGVRKDIKDCLALMDVYLFPSLYEGLGIVLLEAQAAGVYCYASTGVSRESDMGLGLIEYLDLEMGQEGWAERICANLQYQKPTRDKVEEAFKQKGYYISESVTLLEKIYDGNS